MTHTTVATPAVEAKTCADCPYFQSHDEPRYIATEGGQRIPNSRHAAGWCRLFNCFCKEHHEQTQNCINTSDREVTHELEDNLEFSPNIGLDAFLEEEDDDLDEPYTEYEVGSIVKAIDRDEHHEEWGVFEVIECKQNRSLHRHTESCLTEASWFLRHLLNGGNPRNAVSRFFRLASRDDASTINESLWIREDEICHFDDEVRCAESSLYNRRLEQSHLIGIKDIKLIQTKEAKTVKPKPILRHNRQETVNSDDERYTVIRTWNNGGVWMGSRVESV